MSAELIALALFILALSALLWFKRKNLELQRIAWPLLYLVLYRTRLGLAAMGRFSSRHRRLLGVLGWLSIALGLAGMVMISVTLVWNLWSLLTQPGALPGVGIVLPVRLKGVFYVPLFYWIIAIAVLAAVHEFWHGVTARHIRLRVRSSGFAFLALFLPIIPAAFVEPDEAALRRRVARQQLAVLSAGSFANIVLGGALLALFIAIAPAATQALYLFEGMAIVDVVNGSAAELAGLHVNDTIVAIDGMPVLQAASFSEALAAAKPGQEIIISTKRANLSAKLGSHPENASKAFLGVSVQQLKRIKPELSEAYGILPDVAIWLLGLLFWLWMLNLGVGLFNLAPIGGLDGGRMSQLLLRKILSQPTADKLWRGLSFFFGLIVIINVVAGFVG